MADILTFRKREAPPEPTEPHGTGEAFCAGCGHVWQAVVPVGTTEFECPECHAHKGRWRFEFTPPGGMVWTCNCGNQLFNSTPDGVFCPQCGTFARF